ncbi:MAG: hypothetical protein U0Q14_02825 [Dermatophilaceae bacterium]
MDVPREPSGYERYHEARSRGDVEAMTAIALDLAGQAQFNLHPGSLPGLLHELLSRTEPPARTRVGCALARIWSYAGEPTRARPFAVAALAEARELGDRDLQAEALDAQLLTSWGPDDLAARKAVTHELAELAAYLSPLRRMNAHLWRLTTALEVLDAVTTERELRALEALADETGDARIRFYADSRLAMRALMVGHADLATELRLNCQLWATECDEPDAVAVDHALAAGIARLRCDPEALASEAEAFEGFGTAQGVPSVIAEAASLWLAAGRPDRAEALAERVVQAGIGALPRDVDWLLIVASIAGVACATGRVDWAAEAHAALAPLTGRAVVDAGAVGFHGVVEHHLALCARALGEPERAQEYAARARSLYRRVGAHAWEERIESAFDTGKPLVPLQHDAAARADPLGGSDAGALTYWLAPTGDGSWKVGRLDAPVLLRHLVGLGYLHTLVSHPDVDIPALSLAGGGQGDPSGAGAVDPLLDDQALAAYRRRLADIDAELDLADDTGDATTAAALADERDQILAHVRVALGLGGRARTFGSDAERARVAVRRAIRTAYDRLGEVDPRLAEVLRREVTTGYQCSYRPLVGVTWRLDR